jgi:hypothetical protein
MRAARRAQFAGLFLWSARVGVTERPGKRVICADNWPHEPSMN